MSAPYYADDAVTLWHGRCEERAEVCATRLSKAQDTLFGASA